MSIVTRLREGRLHLIAGKRISARDGITLLDDAANTIDAVLDIHSPKVTYLPHNPKHVMCSGCSADYPCATVLAIDETRTR